MTNINEVDTLPLAQEITGQEVAIMPARKCPYCKVITNFNRGAVHQNPDGTKASLDQCQNERCSRYVYFLVTDASGYEVKDHYPKASEDIPEGVTGRILDAYVEAQRCLSAKAPNGSLCMCRRAIDESADALIAKAAPSKFPNSPIKKDDIPTKLNWLASNHLITPDLKEWADQPRIGGRLAAHGTGAKEWGDSALDWATENDAKEVLEFAETFFEYVFTMPERLSKRKSSHTP